MKTTLSKATLILAAIFLSAGCAVAKDSDTPRPNILFCFADDWGWPHAGAYGDPVVKTPTFDRIAKEGVLFQHAFVSSPSCTPSRNAILTGQQFYRLGPGANLWSTLDIKHPNFMYLLREAGYAIGHWRKAWGPGKHQLGGYKESPCGPQQRFNRFIEQHDTTKPFCFWFGTSDPHRAYKAGSGKQAGIDVTKVSVPKFYPDTTAVRSDIADYYFEVQRWDSDVAKAITLLKEKGLLENTIIVMSGDHGMPFPRCKGNLYDWGARVPLAIRWGSQIPAGRTLTDFVSLTDLAPTFLTAAGLPVPDTMTGSSLLPILKSTKTGRVDTQRNHIVFGRERHTVAQEGTTGGYPSRGIRTDSFLYIRNYEPDRWPAGTPNHEKAFKSSSWLSDCDNSPTKYYLWANQDFDDDHRRFYNLSFGKRPSEELYLLADDPDQIRNLADNPDHKDTRERLSKQLSAYLKQTEDPRETDADIHFDTHPYLGGAPGWPGPKIFNRYKKQR